MTPEVKKKDPERKIHVKDVLDNDCFITREFIGNLFLRQ